MSNQSSSQLEQSGRQAVNATSSAARTSIRAGRTVARIGEGTAISASAFWYVWLALLVVVVILVIYGYLYENINYSGGDETLFKTPKNAEKIVQPETVEELTSVTSKKQSIDKTLELAGIIADAKKEERDKLEQQLSSLARFTGKTLTFKCDTDEMPVLVCDDVDSYGTPYDYAFAYAQGTAVSLTGKATSSAQVIEGACRWAVAIAEDNTFHYGKDIAHGGSKCAHHSGCYFCGNNGKYKSGIYDYEHTYVCNTFVYSAFAHGGGDADMLRRCKRNANSSMYIWSDNSHFVSYRYSTVKNSLRRGDVLWWQKPGGGCHVMLYLGNGKVVHASGQDDGRKGSRRWNNSISVVNGIPCSSSIQYVSRYIGSGGGEMEIPGNAASSSIAQTSLTPENYRTTLKNISLTQGKRVNLSSVAQTAQSFTYGDGKFYVYRCIPGRGGAYGYFETYSKDGSLLNTGRYATSTGHGNGLEYYNGTLYSTYAGTSGTHKAVYKVDPQSLEVQERINIANSASGIAYDKSSSEWVIAQRDYIRLYGSDLSRSTKAIKKKGSHGSDYVQDCMAAGGVVYHAVHTPSGVNYIDLYRETDGEYLGSYTSSGAEIESLTLTESGELVILYHMSGSNDFIQFTGITIETGVSSQGSDYRAITTGDIDILSAYSISLSNGDTALDKNSKDTSIIDGLLQSNRYRDINGKIIKTFWDGKDTGKLDPAKDLKQKLKKTKFYSREYEVTENGSSVTVTLSELPAHELCEELFGVDPKAEYVNAYSPIIPVDDDARDSGTNRYRELDDDNEYSVTSNATVLYAMSSETSHLLFTGLAERPKTSDYTILTGGSLAFPLPEDTWTQTDYFGSYEDVRNGRSHGGVDLAANKGTPTFASKGGTVKIASWYGGYGNCVVLQCEGGMEIYYGHLSSISVSKGDKVSVGTKLGEVGSTGWSTGTHLHYEIRINGVKTDPAPLLGNGVKTSA